MEIQAIGAAVTPLESAPVQHVRELSAHAPAHHATAPPAPPAASDVATALATQIAIPDLARLTAILQPNSSSEVAAHITELTQDTTSALAQGNRTRALANLNEIAALDPRTIAVLAPDEVLQPIRPEVDQLLNRLTTVAKMDAEGWLTQADQALETPGHTAITDWQTKPATLLEAAHRLYESGGYTNYVRSADLAQTLVDPAAVAYSPFLEEYAASLATKAADPAIRPENEELLPKKPALPSAAETFTALRGAAMPRVQVLWNRAPLLVLLLGWLTAGLIAGPAAILLRGLWPEIWPASLVDFGFEVWGIGFLALVCFGFYARVRTIAFSRSATTQISVLPKPTVSAASIVHE
jgi:hypothetical protein